MPRLSGRVHRGSEESKRRILDATLELAASRGYEGTTVALVSDASGLPVGSVYWHFENKDKLFVALLERTYAQWLRALRDQPPSSSEDGPRESLLHIMAASTDESDPSHGFWRLGLILTLERRLSSSLARQEFLNIRVEVRALMEKQWRRALPAPVLAADPGLPARIAALVMATADGIYIAMSAGEGDRAREMVDLLFDALDALVAQR